MQPGEVGRFAPASGYILRVRCQRPQGLIRPSAGIVQVGHRRPPDWQRSLRRVFEEANVGGNAHMFRHTFATDLLTRGVPIEDVSILLGHGTPAITAKYYAHFVKARRERLEERVRQLWS